MRIHVHLEFDRKALIRRNPILPLVRLHTPFKPIVVSPRFGSDPGMVVKEELDALHVMLEPPVCHLGHVYLER